MPPIGHPVAGPVPGPDYRRMQMPTMTEKRAPNKTDVLETLYYFQVTLLVSEIGLSSYKGGLSLV